MKSNIASILSVLMRARFLLNTMASSKHTGTEPENISTFTPTPVVASVTDLSHPFIPDPTLPWRNNIFVLRPQYSGKKIHINLSGARFLSCTE
jgi:hypothetical protein